jgi:hypothetical protein
MSDTASMFAHSAHRKPSFAKDGKGPKSVCQMRSESVCSSSARALLIAPNKPFSLTVNLTV